MKRLYIDTHMADDDDADDDDDDDYDYDDNDDASAEDMKIIRANHFPIPIILSCSVNNLLSHYYRYSYT